MSSLSLPDAPQVEPLRPHAATDTPLPVPNEELTRALAANQARVDFDAARAAASLLTPDGLKELRAWIDARLRECEEAETDVVLSEREADVLRRIALGHSNKEIAAQLELSVKTVETYKTRSMEKLNFSSRVDIVRYAVKRGWLRPADPPAA